MSGAQCRHPWRSLVFAALLLAVFCPATPAKESNASLKDAEQYVAKGDLKSAEIELRNAVRESPQDPMPRARLAQIYLEEGDGEAAEREARAAGDRNGDEAEYLPILANALLLQQKFADVAAVVKPGDRPPLSRASCGLRSALRRPV
jgi:cellulose synthase operon protein C